MLGLTIKQSTMTMATETIGRAAAVITVGCSRTQGKGSMRIIIKANGTRMTTTIIKKSGMYTRGREIATMIAGPRQNKIISTLTSLK